MKFGSTASSSVTLLVTYAMVALATLSAASSSSTVQGGVRFSSSSRARGKGNKAESETCHDALKRCKHDKVCKDAMEGLETVCAVKGDRCNAEMPYLSKCAEIMDLLRQKIDLDRPCLCKKRSTRCSLIHDLVYDNPCFKSVTYLRKLDMLPKLEDIKVLKTKTPAPAPETQSSSSAGGKKSLLESLMLYSDHRSEPGNAASTAIVEKKNGETATMVQQTTDVESPKENENNLRRPNHRPTPHDDGVLLHVVAIATGVLVFLTLIVGASLLVYFSMHKNPLRKETEKQATMT